MGKIVAVAAPVNYSGTRGQGPVLVDGKHNVRVAAAVFTDDSVSNPFDLSAVQTEKVRAWDVAHPIIAAKLTCAAGGITERFHTVAFLLFASLTELQKAEKDKKGNPRYTEDMATGYALEIYRDAAGKAVMIDSEVMDADGVTPLKRPALCRAIDTVKSETAVRILSDFLVALGIPAKAEMSLEEMAEAIAASNATIQITVSSKEYDGKRRARMSAPTAIGTTVAVPVAAAEKAVAPEEVEEF